MNWQTGIIRGIGGAIFAVDGERDGVLVVRYVTIVQVQPAEEGRAYPFLLKYPLEMFGFSQGAHQLWADHVTLRSPASDIAIDAAEQAWELKQVLTPARGLVKPLAGGNGS